MADAADDLSGMFSPVLCGVFLALLPAYGDCKAAVTVAVIHMFTAADMEFEACSDMPIPALCSPTGHRQWKDIDREDRDNPLACAYYANDIMSALFKAEASRRMLERCIELYEMKYDEL